MPVQISVIGAVAAALLTAAIVAFITTPVVRTLALGTTAGCTTTPFPGWGVWPSFSALSSAP